MKDVRFKLEKVQLALASIIGLQSKDQLVASHSTFYLLAYFL